MDVCMNVLTDMWYENIVKMYDSFNIVFFFVWWIINIKSLLCLTYFNSPPQHIKKIIKWTF